VKIGVISQWYAPEPAFIPSNLAVSLAARGHEVRVLTGFPHYPAGSVYPGYRQRWRGREDRDGVALRRVPAFASHDESALRRAATYLSFAATSALAAPRFLAGVDVVYVYLTPATAYAAAGLLRLLRRTPTVVHVQDLWPESVTQASFAPRGLAGRLVHRGLTAAMRHVYGSAAGIAVIAPSMRDIVVARGADPHRVRVVLNWTDEALFHPVATSPEARRAIGHRNRCTIMYAGSMGPFQNVEDSVRAAAAVSDVDLVLIGSGTQESAAQDLAATLGAGNVRFLGRREPHEMAALYGAADYQLVTLKDLPIFRGTIPSKLQAALAAGSPVVVSVPGDCADIVRRDRIGLACPPEDWRALAAQFRAAATIPAADRDAMARRARDAYQARMSKRAGVDQLEDLLFEAGNG